MVVTVKVMVATMNSHMVSVTHPAVRTGFSELPAMVDLDQRAAV
jgi:hypothetical protein